MPVPRPTESTLDLSEVSLEESSVAGVPKVIAPFETGQRRRKPPPSPERATAAAVEANDHDADAEAKSMWVVSAEGSPDDLELTTKELVDAVQSDRLSVDTFVWQKDMKNWRPICEIEKLASMLRTAPRYEKTGGFLGTGMKLSVPGDNGERALPVARPPVPRRESARVEPPAKASLQNPPRARPTDSASHGDDFGWLDVGSVAPPPSIDVDDLGAPASDDPPGVDLTGVAESVPPESLARDSRLPPDDFGERPSQPLIDVESVLEGGERLRTSRPPPLPLSSYSEPGLLQSSGVEHELRGALVEHRHERGRGLSGMGRAAAVVAVLAAALWWLAREQSLPLLVGEPTLVQSSAATVGLPAVQVPVDDALVVVDAEDVHKVVAVRVVPPQVARAEQATSDAEPPERAVSPKASASRSTGEPNETAAEEPVRPERAQTVEVPGKQKAFKGTGRAQASGTDAARDTASADAVTAPFSAGSARTALDAAAVRASSCRREGDPSGVARVTVTFAPSGRVTSANVAGPPFAGTQTGGCIAASMRRARVPAFDGERVTVTKTVVIQ